MSSSFLPEGTVTAALVSVGGTPDPVLHVLRAHQPPHVWFFCSEGTRDIAENIQNQLDWRLQARFLVVSRFEELGPCYAELRKKLPEIMSETRVSASEVMVDYTGGTKTMSAALVLAGVEFFHRFSYVGGEQREKGGLGITIKDRERVRYQGNPWSELAIREVERAREAWSSCRFDAAASELRDVASLAKSRAKLCVRLDTSADVAEAMSARHRLDFKSAQRAFGAAAKRLPALFDDRDDHGLIAWVKESCALCSQCYGNGLNPDVLLRELLDNTLRTANQGRYEDAAARLYRAMEMRGQLWLEAATEGLIKNGRCPRAKIGALPAKLRELPAFEPNAQGDVKLGQEQVFKALALLANSHAEAIMRDIESKSSQWRIATEKRNTSILAHGVSSIGEEGFEQMKDVATEFLEFNLERESKPIPPLDIHWCY